MSGMYSLLIIFWIILLLILVLPAILERKKIRSCRRQSSQERALVTSLQNLKKLTEWSYYLAKSGRGPTEEHYLL